MFLSLFSPGIVVIGCTQPVVAICALSRRYANVQCLYAFLHEKNHRVELMAARLQRTTVPLPAVDLTSSSHPIMPAR